MDFLQFEDIQQFAAMKQSLLLSGFPVAQGSEVLDAYWLVIKRCDHMHLFRILTPMTDPSSQDPEESTQYAKKKPTPVQAYDDHGNWQAPANSLANNPGFLLPNLDGPSSR